MQLRVPLESLIFSAVIIELVLMDLAHIIFIGIFDDLFTFRKKNDKNFLSIILKKISLYNYLCMIKFVASKNSDLSIN